MRRKRLRVTDDAIEQMLRTRSRRPDAFVLDNILTSTLQTPRPPKSWVGGLAAVMGDPPRLAAGVVLLGLLGGALAAGGAIQSQRGADRPSEVRSIPTQFETRALEGGRYYIDNARFTAVPFSFALPSGWTSENHGQSLAKFGTPLGEVGLATFVLQDVYADACASDEREVPIGPTVDDLIGALVSQIGPRKSGPFEITLDGHPGKRLDLSVPPALDPSRCRFGGGLQIWRDRGDFFQAVVPDGRLSVYAVDVDGHRLILVTSYRAGSSAAQVAELEAIIASIRFEW